MGPCLSLNDGRMSRNVMAGEDRVSKIKGDRDGRHYKHDRGNRHQDSVLVPGGTDGQMGVGVDTCSADPGCDRRHRISGTDHAVWRSISLALGPGPNAVSCMNNAGLEKFLPLQGEGQDGGGSD